MSSCWSAGGRTATYKFDLEIVKSPPTSFLSSHSSSSSPSSTISESSNCPLTISTRKPRTPRKRPNQTYNEAAALLSTAYPNIFSTIYLSKNPCKFSKPSSQLSSSEESSAELLLDFPVYEKPTSNLEPRLISSFENQLNCAKLSDGYDGQEEEFDAESILDEEIEEGIDSIMGKLTVSNNGAEEYSNGPIDSFSTGWPFMGLGHNFVGGLRRGVRAFRKADERDDWWTFPTVNVEEISPRLLHQKTSTAKKKKKKKEVNDTTKNSNSSNSKALSLENSPPKASKNSGMLLKLNYDEVLNAWSDRGSPFSDAVPGPELSGSDSAAKSTQVDLFAESGGVREASVQRYKEKRRARLFSKKIRYQVRKVTADQRPRMKGRFVRSPNSNGAVVEDERINGDS
ncbi:hypothetical protein Nepgr_015444 [Nepenthes gracilis]|uniref:CCT domain-containing protein n=1 Tax=Nepenthes gracilis TaxID=150966 RepID=A0AAD3XQQ0_NEPGR|nr:hypothetical protein Nepgr_015444 [Nepenthes gracilis]